ncbi:MAG: GDSL-type esterase/lipase family protein [Flavobacteriaceae bacterium]|nr:GDSL-type esterase/lipase family protein [Flavobacteriaceae bacterium]
MQFKQNSTLFVILVVGLFASTSCSPLRKYKKKDRKWAYPEIQAFEQLDKTQTYAADALLFIGSSSIRLWKTLEEDMKPYPVIQRGYGGAHFRDMVFFTDRILADHSLSMVVCFVANDISGSNKDGTPQEVLMLFKHFIKQVRAKHPSIPILQVAITPTQSRWSVWPQIKRVNELIKAYCEETENLYFINTVPEFLDEKGQPKTQWFVGDQLHLNQKGYEVWNRIIKGEIEKVKG